MKKYLNILFYFTFFILPSEVFSAEKIFMEAVELPVIIANKTEAPVDKRSDIEKLTNHFISWQFATYKTSATALYNTDHLYVIFKNDGERTDKLAAGHAEPPDNELLWKDSSNSIYIDPERTNTDAVFFSFNSKGLGFGFGKNLSKNWKGAWTASTTIEGPDRWAAIADCDFSKTGITPKAGSIWGINLSRHAGTGEGRFGYRTYPLNHYRPSCDYALLIFGPLSKTNFNISATALEKRTGNDFALNFNINTAKKSTIPDTLTFDLTITNPEFPAEKILTAAKLADFRKSDTVEIPFKYKIKRDGRQMLTFTARDENGLTAGVWTWNFYSSSIPEKVPCPLRFVPRKWTPQAGRWLMPEKLKMAIIGQGDKFPAELISEKIKASYGVNIDIVQKDADITMEYTDPEDPVNPESFSMTVKKESIHLKAPASPGMYYAARAFLEYLSYCFIKNETASADCVSMEDIPDVPTRIFIWYPEFDLMFKKKPDMETYKKFFYEQIAGGRYNLMFILCKGAVKYDSHPELINNPAYNGNYFSKAEIKEMIDFLRKHYVEVEPGGDSPGHSEWLAKPLPELSEDAADNVVCTKNPKTLKVLKDCYSELLELFKPAKYFFLSGGEVFYQTAVADPEKRCRLCAGITKGSLLLEHFKQLNKFCHEKHVAPVIWSDMLSRDWNGGGRWQTCDALKELPRDFILVSWDGTDHRAVPPEKLKEMGFNSLWRATTVFKSTQMDTLARTWNIYSGQGMAEDYPYLWCNFQSSGDESGYCTPAILSVAAATWRHETADDGFIKALQKYGNAFTLAVGIPEMGLRNFRLEKVKIEGSGSDKSLKNELSFKFIKDHSQLPDILKTQDKDAPNSFIKVSGKNLKALPIDSDAAGIIFSHTLKINNSKEIQELKKRFAGENTDVLGLPIAVYIVEYMDGSITEIPVRLGYNIHFMNCPPPLRIMPGTLGYKTGISNRMAMKDPDSPDIAFWLMVWKNPTPSNKIKSLKIQTALPEKSALIIDAVTLIKTDNILK